MPIVKLKTCGISKLHQINKERHIKLTGNKIRAEKIRTQKHQYKKESNLLIFAKWKIHRSEVVTNPSKRKLQSLMLSRNGSNYLTSSADKCCWSGPFPLYIYILNFYEAPSNLRDRQLFSFSLSHSFEYLFWYLRETEKYCSRKDEVIIAFSLFFSFSCWID